MTGRELKMPEHKLPESPTSGVVPMSIVGRMKSERERLIGMTDEERAWRKQWLKDQILSKNEPRIVPEYYTQMYNPIRRAYIRPLDSFFMTLQPVLGKYTSSIRYYTGKALIMSFTTVAIYYYFKYNSGDWMRKKGIRMYTSSMTCFTSDKNIENYYVDKKPADYADQGFKTSPI